MKKKYSVTLILVLFILLLYSTYSYSQIFKGGVLAGFNASQVDGDDLKGYNKLGLNVGFFIETKFNKKFNYQFEIKYMHKGSSKKLTEKDNESYKINLDYIEIPVLLKYKYNEKLNLLGGLSLGYLMDGFDELHGYRSPYDQADEFNEIDISGILGITYKLKEKLRIDLRFQYSLIPIRQFLDNVPIRFNKNQFNNVISTSLFYVLDLKK